MEIQEKIKHVSGTIRNSVTLKIFSTALLVLILLIPSAMVSSLIAEREDRRDSVVKEINQKWGDSQIVTGPFFSVPYRSYYRDAQNKEKFNLLYLHILPEKLEVKGAISTQIRSRSLYEAVLYSMQAGIKGKFTFPAPEQLDIDWNNILWDKAVFSIGISDMRGITKGISVAYAGRKFECGPGLTTTDIAPSGVSVVIPLSPQEPGQDFAFELSLNGSEQMHFVPLAETTSVQLQSDWPSPSFNGAFLPTERKVGPQGFSARWNVLHLNRNYPQHWVGNQYKVDSSSFGLNLLITADVYQKTTRIAKYAVMFIVFTFTAFFFTEVINRKRIHPVQYLLIGLAVILFYTSLLSLSEYLEFNRAYLLSAGIITLIITGYSSAIVRNRYFTMTIFSILLILYSYLFIVLQLEDYALLMGSAGLLAVLTTVMFITRKINWYELDMGANQ